MTEHDIRMMFEDLESELGLNTVTSTPTEIPTPIPNQLTPTLPAKTTPSTKLKVDALAIKAFAIALAILFLIGSLCLTAYMNHKTKEAILEANSIISSASLEAEEIVETANENASNKIADANAEAEKIKEDT